MKKILILGCTGSIGTSALDIIRSQPDRFSAVGLSAHSRPGVLASLAREFRVSETALTGDETGLHGGFRYYGRQGLAALIANTDADIVLNGIAGASGLFPSIEVLKRGLDLALANKETIVMAGPLIKALAAEKNCRILPVDSEHSAIFNLTERFGKSAIEKVILTASGGPFRLLDRAALEKVSAADALKHPTWNMGQKITIDSASLANKGLEVIEACRLFDMPPSSVEVVVHPQSIVHSLVRTKDGVLYAQMSPPDMKHPILSAFNWPEYAPNALSPLDFSMPLGLSFEPPRFDAFPMLTLAYEAAERSAGYPIVYNGANEVAVAAFAAGRIGFMDIGRITEAVLSKDWTEEPRDFDTVFRIDANARAAADTSLLQIQT